MKNDKSSKLTHETIVSLEQIFEQKQWSLKNKYEQNIFNRFCRMLENLSLDQQECILELTKNFLRIDFNDYYNQIKKVLSQIEDHIVRNIQHVYIMPVSADYSRRGSSSAFTVAYMFEDPVLYTGTFLEDIPFSIIQKPEGLPKNLKNKPKLLLLVDDFIGSGETIIGCLNSFGENFPKEKLVVLSIVIQNKGLELLTEMNIQTYYSVLRVRGINDMYTNSQRDELVNRMNSIEDFLNVIPKNRFGRNQTEALVKLMRTPNNTFPVYWDEPMLNNGKQFCAPFPRDH